jgi:hypothetical protein
LKHVAGIVGIAHVTHGCGHGQTGKAFVKLALSFAVALMKVLQELLFSNQKK